MKIEITTINIRITHTFGQQRNNTQSVAESFSSIILSLFNYQLQFYGSAVQFNYVINGGKIMLFWFATHKNLLKDNRIMAYSNIHIADLDVVLNYVQINDKIATSGQPRAEQFKLIAKHGYTSVINLAMHDAHNTEPNEQKILHALGISYNHIPVPFDAPSTSHLLQFIETLNSLESQRVWIHCALNYRVSAFMYLYLRHIKGLSEKQAKYSILKRWKPDTIWSKFMSADHKLTVRKY